MNLYTLYKKYTNRKHTIGYKFILSLFVGLIGIISFGYCDYLNGLQFITNVTYNSNSLYQTTPGQLGFPTNEGLLCFNINSWGGSNRLLIGWNGTDTASYRFQTDKNYSIDLFGCFQKNLGTDNIPIYIGAENFYPIQSFDIDFYYIPTSSYNIVSGEPGYTKGECQVKYNLIPIENVDQHYCETNELCPENECTGTGLDWSALFINNIQYPGAPTIKLTIPEEIEREQNTDEEETNIDVIGYGYDQDKMQQMVNTQYYKPTAEEMSGLMEKVADFLPLVAVALLIARIRRVIKKVF